MEINFFDPKVNADPFPYYEQIRAAGRVVYNDAMHSWMVPGYDDAVAMKADIDHFSSRCNLNDEVAMWFEGVRSMIAVDPPEHARLRGPLTDAFSKRSVSRWEPRIIEVVDELVDGLLMADGPVNIVDAFAAPLPTTVVAELLGVPKDREPDFQRWSNLVVANLTYGTSPDEPQEHLQFEEGAREMQDFLREMVEERRRRPSDDVFGYLVANAETLDLSDDDIRATAVLLLLAGYDTTATLLANAVVALAQHPDQRRLLVSQPDLVPGGIEEIMRCFGVTQIDPRLVAKDVDFAGAHLSEGELVFVLSGATGRDPSRWEDPARFDVTRPPKTHFAFGYGIHLCLGAHLARLESRIGISRLLRKIPDFDVVGVDYGSRFAVRGPLYAGFVPDPALVGTA